MAKTQKPEPTEDRSVLWISDRPSLESYIPRRAPECNSLTPRQGVALRAVTDSARARNVRVQMNRQATEAGVVVDKDAQAMRLLLDLVGEMIEANPDAVAIRLEPVLGGKAVK